MKLLILLMLSLTQLAWAQVETGSVVFVDFAQDEITVAADSRSFVPAISAHVDTECKISAFGNKFVFSLAGYASAQGRWTAASEARKVWESQSKIVSNVPILDRVVEGWITVMKNIYSDPVLIADARKRMEIEDDPIVASAVFAAMDKSGNLRSKLVEIYFDIGLFDLLKQIRIVPKVIDVTVGQSSLGHSEIIDEFRNGTTERARDYMNWYTARIASLPLHQRRAEFTSKMAELTVLLHPDKDALAFPIDVLQLRQRTGVHWVWKKPNCPEN